MLVNDQIKKLERVQIIYGVFQIKYVFFECKNEVDENRNAIKNLKQVNLITIVDGLRKSMGNM